MNPVLEFEIYDTVYSYAKIYPEITKLITFNQPIMVRKKGYESRMTEQTPRNTSTNPQSALDSLRRTQTRLSDLVISNKFDLFCTFTFAEDRQNVDLLKYRMSRWLKNQNRYIGKFSYLIVPEFHKDGQSIHFHALFKGYKGNLTDSGHKRKDGRAVYNLDNYNLGFSTATKIDEAGVPLVSSYIKKYITKDMPQFDNKRRYWCSHNLTRPKKIMNPNYTQEQLNQFTQEHQSIGFTTKIANQSLDIK